jgi:hypothetical protein
MNNPSKIGKVMKKYEAVNPTAKGKPMPNAKKAITKKPKGKKITGPFVPKSAPGTPELMERGVRRGLGLK